MDRLKDGKYEEERKGNLQSSQGGYVLLPDSPEVKVNGSTVVEIKEGEDDALVPWLDRYARIRKMCLGVIEHCNANYKRALLLTNTGN